MTDDELLAWGRKEWVRRAIDLQGVKGGFLAFDRVKADAASRREAVGLTAEQAAEAVGRAQRAI